MKLRTLTVLVTLGLLAGDALGARKVRHTGTKLTGVATDRVSAGGRLELRGEGLDSWTLHKRLQIQLKGTFSEVRRTCGHPGCKCARGDKHLCRQLSASVEGKTRTCNVPLRYAAKVKRLTDDYRRFRRARTVWGQTNRQILELINELEAARTVPDFRDEPRRQKG